MISDKCVMRHAISNLALCIDGDRGRVLYIHRTIALIVDFTSELISRGHRTVFQIKREKGSVVHSTTKAGRCLFVAFAKILLFTDYIVRGVIFTPFL